MAHHHTHHRGGARSCSRRDSTQRSRPEQPSAIAWPGTSRIGPAPNREARVPKVAGQGRIRAPRRDPDCWGRLQLILSRLIGGRE